MPLYEYECGTCGHRTEVIQRVGATPIGPCSECGGPMKRLISAPAFQFKGSGWYVTDYARKRESAGEGSKAAAEGDKPAKPKPDAASKADGGAGSKGSDKTST